MKIAIGTAQFGLKYGISNQSGKVSFEEAREIIKNATQRGIDTVDTAIGYGDSEDALGAIGVKSWKVVSKLPETPIECLDVKKWVYDQVVGSLSRLGMDSLYALLLHKPNELLSNKGALLYEALESLKRKGLVQKIGISIYTPDELPHLFQNMHFDMVQAPFSILDKRLLVSGWMNKLKSLKVELHVRSIFLQGLLLMPSSERPNKFSKWASLWNEWDRWLCTHNLTPLEACLRYVLSIEEIDKIVIGVLSKAQLNEICDIKKEKLKGLPDWPQEIDAQLVNPALWSQL